MGTISRLCHRNLLTWAKMSIVVLTVTAITMPAQAGIESETFEFGMKIVKAEQQQAKTIKRQLACLARNVFYEANGEPMQGQMAVAQVTINRANSGLFPRDLCAVITQSTKINEDTRVCQFSWMCDSKVNKNRIIDKNNPSYIAAKSVFLEGKRVANIDRNVMYFHRSDLKTDPSWPHTVTAQIGNHVFYKRTRN
jgi:N-acetylmuramoyl-L-alanine amidase